MRRASRFFSVERLGFSPSYNYAALACGAVPAAWTLYTATISGVEQNGVLTPGVFWPGTAYIKPVILFNNQSQADNLVTWRDVSWTYASPATFQKGDEVALHVGGVTPGTSLTFTWTQLSGPTTVILQNAQTATASFVVPSGLSGSLTFQVTVSNGTTSIQGTVTVVTFQNLLEVQSPSDLVTGWEPLT